MLNTPRELTHMPLPGSNVNLPRPKGTRLVARRLNAEDSAKVRGAMGRGPVACRCPDGSVRRVSIRKVGRTAGKANVTIPMKPEAYARMIANVRAKRPVNVTIPSGAGGSRLMQVKPS